MTRIVGFVVTILIAVLVAGPLAAQEIIVHANFPIGTVPAECRDMTAKQFREWAISQNMKALKNAEAKHQAYLEARGPLGPVVVNEHSGGNYVQLGGLNGGAGVGGTGGLLTGYGGTGYQSSNGFGRSNFYTGNTIRSSYTDNTRSYQVTPRDWNDDGGGPVEIINPFCFDFWKNHVAE
jgi:hypothetical protein